jgi:hypothetical protein
MLLDNRRTREGLGSGSVSTPLTNESGSGRPKNMWIRWIPIRIRIWNIALPSHFLSIPLVLDPDSGIAILKRILADPDPEHCFKHFLPPLKKKKIKLTMSIVR